MKVLVPTPTITTLLALAGVARIVLILWGELQDRYFDVNYTDIDYEVFTDAARYVAEGRSPFERDTYRYSPLIAYLLLPNVFFPWFGKVWFVTFWRCIMHLKA
jgi:GPI mannosyltransferase 1 subunit M